VTKVLQTGAAQPAVVAGFRWPDGKTHWIVVRAMPIKEPTTGLLLGAMATLLDITERKQTEEELQRNREMTRKAQELAQVGSWEWDLTSDHVIWTDQMYEIHGLDPERFAGGLKQARQFVHPEDRENVRVYGEKLFAGNGPVTVHYRIRRPDGTERYVWSSAEIMRDGAGRPVKMIGAVQDITERQQVEMQLRHMQRLESIGQLAGGIAHEFNNLLQPIISSADLILREAPNVNATEIKAAAARAAELSRQLLTFGRRQPFQPGPLDLNRLIEGFEALLRLTLGSDIRVETVLARGLSAVLGDRGQLEQVLMNLAVNARDAMPQGGRLKIETRKLEADEAGNTATLQSNPGLRRCIELTVSDTGVGMRAEVLARAFDPFFTTKEAVSGTGLGLAVVDGIIQTHGGRILVESRPGEGSTFRIYLPAEAEAAPLTEEASEPVADSTGGETLLLVDDDAAVLRSTMNLLRSANYHVIAADGAESALALYLEHAREIDLVVTDMIMPGRSGVELVRELRRRRPETRVLFITGCAPEKMGDLADPILDKPYSAHELLAALRSALDRKPAHRSS
jgi:PAS domain S-box-containing protein